MVKDAAAIILCAGKGTRMNDDSKNKVCFECAGIPVIRRIIDNMKKGGISRFVIVIGHQAYSVMDCLDGIDGIIYAYQKYQKGTGHAALCGLQALTTIGYTGPVIVSMGDKIVAPNVISGLLEQAQSAKSVWGVQPLSSNFNGGRVVISDGKPCGIVEFSDAALMSLADTEPEQYAEVLKKIGLNEKKAKKVCEKALNHKPPKTKTLCGKEFTAQDILQTPFANAGLYCFDAQTATQIIRSLGSDNAQEEVYLTDALEILSRTDDAKLYEINSPGDMLTYSTKSELREISSHFMRSVSDFKNDIQSGSLDSYFTGIYCEHISAQKERYLALLDTFQKKYGNQKVIITRSPGRINLMGRHIDHRGGCINVMATNADTVFIASPRKDDIIRLTNTDTRYPERIFSLTEELKRADSPSWIDYLDHPSVVSSLKDNQGDWSNYVKGAVLRAQFGYETPLCGMDIAADGTIPIAAGLSSSSSIVVATMEAIDALNCLNLSVPSFINACGEGEWFVGSRGGAGDHAAMKCCTRNHITQLGFKPFSVGNSADFSNQYAILVANSMIKAKKSEGSRDTFNSKVASYEFSLLLLEQAFPDANLKEFRDIAEITPYSSIYQMIKILPETATRDEIRAALPNYGDTIDRIFSSHADPGYYDLRGVTLFGISECLRAKHCMSLLNNNAYSALGDMMKISHNGDRLLGIHVTNSMLDALSAENADPAAQFGSYSCSTKEIDYLCDILNDTDGVLGSEIVGAGLGGCVISLIEKEKAENVISILNQKYYEPNGYESAANIYTASAGSSVLF